MGHRLSKSRYTSGLQCLRQLWWRVHEPDAPELVPDAALQAVFEQGHLVGEAAQALVPGGVLVDVGRDRLKEACQETRNAMEAGAKVLYEASFFAGSVFVAVDILERQEDGWHVVEVKSATGVREHHLDDAAIQAWVVAEAGLEVGRVEVMHINRDFRFPDQGELFTRVDVTDEVRSRLATLPANVERQIQALEGELPDVEIGEHCDDPYECAFKKRCWPELPPDHVSTLWAGGRRTPEFEARGIERIADIPDGEDLLPVQARQRRAVRAGGMIVEPTLADALRLLEPPLAYLDFETVCLALPRWNGCRPYDQVPVQFSCHVESADGALTHHAWLADGPGDPREPLAIALLDACGEDVTVAAYYARFERRCIHELAEALPHLSKALLALAARVEDLLPVVRNHVYHPDFGGGFGLKTVLPALVPELGYEDLEIADGMTASNELKHMLFHGESMDPDERSRLRAALLTYCELDTKAMVALRRKLVRLAEEAGTPR